MLLGCIHVVWSGDGCDGQHWVSARPQKDMIAMQVPRPLTFLVCSRPMTHAWHQSVSVCKAFSNSIVSRSLFKLLQWKPMNNYHITVIMLPSKSINGVHILDVCVLVERRILISWAAVQEGLGLAAVAVISMLCALRWPALGERSAQSMLITAATVTPPPEKPELGRAWQW